MRQGLLVGRAAGEQLVQGAQCLLRGGNRVALAAGDRGAQAPKCVRGHGQVARATREPAEGAVCVLHLHEAPRAVRDQTLQLGPTCRVRRVHGLQRRGRLQGRQEAVHRLLDTPVGVPPQLDEDVVHGRRPRRRDRHLQARATGDGLGRNRDRVDVDTCSARLHEARAAFEPRHAARLRCESGLDAIAAHRRLEACFQAHGGDALGERTNAHHTRLARLDAQRLLRALQTNALGGHHDAAVGRHLGMGVHGHWQHDLVTLHEEARRIETRDDGPPHVEAAPSRARQGPFRDAARIQAPTGEVVRQRDGDGGLAIRSRLDARCPVRGVAEDPARCGRRAVGVEPGLLQQEASLDAAAAAGVQVPTTASASEGPAGTATDPDGPVSCGALVGRIGQLVHGRGGRGLGVGELLAHRLEVVPLRTACLRSEGCQLVGRSADALPAAFGRDRPELVAGIPGRRVAIEGSQYLAERLVGVAAVHGRARKSKGMLHLDVGSAVQRRLLVEQVAVGFARRAMEGRTQGRRRDDRMRAPTIEERARDGRRRVGRNAEDGLVHDGQTDLGGHRAPLRVGRTDGDVQRLTGARLADGLHPDVHLANHDELHLRFEKAIRTRDRDGDHDVGCMGGAQRHLEHGARSFDRHEAVLEHGAGFQGQEGLARTNRRAQQDLSRVAFTEEDARHEQTGIATLFLFIPAGLDVGLVDDETTAAIAALVAQAPATGCRQADAQLGATIRARGDWPRRLTARRLAREPGDVGDHARQDELTRSRHGGEACVDRAHFDTQGLLGANQLEPRPHEGHVVEPRHRHATFVHHEAAGHVFDDRAHEDLGVRVTLGRRHADREASGLVGLALTAGDARQATRRGAGALGRVGPEVPADVVGIRHVERPRLPEGLPRDRDVCRRRPERVRHVDRGLDGVARRIGRLGRGDVDQQLGLAIGLDFEGAGPGPLTRHGQAQGPRADRCQGIEPEGPVERATRRRHDLVAREDVVAGIEDLDQPLRDARKRELAIAHLQEDGTPGDLVTRPVDGAIRVQVGLGGEAFGRPRRVGQLGAGHTPLASTHEDLLRGAVGTAFPHTVRSGRPELADALGVVDQDASTGNRLLGTPLEHPDQEAAALALLHDALDVAHEHEARRRELRVTGDHHVRASLRDRHGLLRFKATERSVGRGLPGRRHVRLHDLERERIDTEDGALLAEPRLEVERVHADVERLDVARDHLDLGSLPHGAHLRLADAQLRRA